jgi:hypothetical protein
VVGLTSTSGRGVTEAGIDSPRPHSATQPGCDPRGSLLAPAERNVRFTHPRIDGRGPAITHSDSCSRADCECHTSWTGGDRPGPPSRAQHRSGKAEITQAKSRRKVLPRTSRVRSPDGAPDKRPNQGHYSGRGDCKPAGPEEPRNCCRCCACRFGCCCIHGRCHASNVSEKSGRSHGSPTQAQASPGGKKRPSNHGKPNGVSLQLV